MKEQPSPKVKDDSSLTEASLHGLHLHPHQHLLLLLSPGEGAGDEDEEGDGEKSAHLNGRMGQV